MSSVFPNEICDRIVDYLHNDTEALSTCALVCSSWIPTVRYHRFKHVLLALPASIDTFHGLLLASPDAVPYATHLDVLPDPRGYEYKTVGPLCALFATTTSLRALRIGCMVFESYQFRSLCLALPESIEHLELDDFFLRPGATLGDLIFLWSRLPRLESFVLFGDTVIHAPDIPEEYEYTRSDAKLLTATELQLLWEIPYFDVLARWLCSQDVPAQLRACTLSFFPEYVAPIARLLRGTGPALEKLEIDLGGGSVVRRVEIFYPCDLAQCTNLRELHLSGRIFGERPDGGTLVHCMSTILTHLCPPGVRTLVLSIAAPNSNVVGWGATQLGSVATAISCNRAFDGLERVIVRLLVWSNFGAPVSEDLFAPVRNIFKTFEERGSLTVKGRRVEYLRIVDELPLW